MEKRPRGASGFSARAQPLLTNLADGRSAQRVFHFEESTASCSSVEATAATSRATSDGTRSREIRRSTTTTGGTSRCAGPMAMPSEAAVPLSILPAVMGGGQ